MLSKPTEYQEKLITTLQQPTISIDETLKVEKPPVTCSVPIKSENNNYRMYDIINCNLYSLLTIKLNNYNK